MYSFNSAWLRLIPVAFTLVGFGSSVESAFAQKTYEFSVPYQIRTELDDTFRPDLNIARVTDIGVSIAADAPFGLTNFLSEAYAKSEFRGTTIFSRFDANPTVFGIEGEILGDRFFGGSNELFTRSSGIFETDLVAGIIKGSGNLAVFGGTGLFNNATGTITFTQENTINRANPTAPALGNGILNFSIQTPEKVPEPATNTALFAMGIIGAGLLVKRRYKSILG